MRYAIALMGSSPAWSLPCESIANPAQGLSAHCNAYFLANPVGRHRLKWDARTTRA